MLLFDAPDKHRKARGSLSSIGVAETYSRRSTTSVHGWDRGGQVRIGCLTDTHRHSSVTQKACVNTAWRRNKHVVQKKLPPLDLGNALDEPHGGAVAVPERLRRRADFLRAAKGKHFHARGLTLQAAPRALSALGTMNRCGPSGSTISCTGTGQTGDPRGIPPWGDAPPRFGFTVTKQSGGAVQRNLIRRRLKEALRLLKPLSARPGHDYVILARPEALRMSFQALQAEIMRALGKIDTDKSPPRIRQDHRRNNPISGGAGGARQKSSKGRTPKG
jgi:ribonuclease P protein component